MKNFLYSKKIDNYILSTTFIFFLIINFIYFYINLVDSNEINVYAFNELFINYQAGFIRRGLLGEIAWQLNKIFSIEPRIFFSYFFFIIYLFQIILFYNLFKRFIITKVFFIFIFFSPSLLLFHIYSPDLFFLKDAIIKLVFLFHAFIFYKLNVLKNNKDKYLEYLRFILIPILFIVILTHEYQVFSLSLHILISIGIIENKKEIKKIGLIYSPLLISILLVILFSGNQSQFENLSQILNVFNVKLNPYLGGGLYHYIGGFYKWHFYYFSYQDFISLFLSFILSFLIFLVFFQYLVEKKIISFHSKFQKKYLFYFLPVFIPIMLTSDHGRNLAFLSFYLVTFFSIFKLDLLKFKKKFNFIFKDIFKKYSIFIFIFFYVFLWKLDQVAGFRLEGKPNGIFKSSLFAEFIKFIKYIYAYVDLNVINLPEIKL